MSHHLHHASWGLRRIFRNISSFQFKEEETEAQGGEMSPKPESREWPGLTGVVRRSGARSPPAVTEACPVGPLSRHSV